MGDIKITEGEFKEVDRRGFLTTLRVGPYAGCLRIDILHLSILTPEQLVRLRDFLNQHVTD